MRTWMIFASIAVVVLAVGPTAIAGETGPVVLERTEVAEGVREWSDADGVHHLCASGRPGLEWNIQRYQGLLAALVTGDGYIEEEDREVARFLVQRLTKLRAIPVLHTTTMGLKTVTCGSGEETCDSPNEFDWETDVDLAYDWGAAGYAVQTIVDSDITDCAYDPPDGDWWWSDGEVLAYVQQTYQGEPVTDSDSGSGRDFTIEAGVSWTIWPVCRYGFAELSVYDNLQDTGYYYYCEDELPKKCSPY